MSADALRHFLLWCSVLNYGILLFWIILFMLPHDWVYRYYARWIAITREQFDGLNFAGMMLYKLGILLFNVIPLIALYVIA